MPEADHVFELLMGNDVPLKGELVDRTLTLSGVKTEGVNAAAEPAAPHVAHQPPALKPLGALNPALPLRLHGAATIVELPCVVDDRVFLHSALDHPHLERPLAFLENEALFPHLARLGQPLPLAQLLHMLAAGMPGHKAQHIAAWLWQRGLLESVG